MLSTVIKTDKHVHTRDFMWPKVITSGTPGLCSSFKVFGHTQVVYFYATPRIITNLALRKKTNKKTDADIVVINIDGYNVYCANRPPKNGGSGAISVTLKFHIQDVSSLTVVHSSKFHFCAEYWTRTGFQTVITMG